MRRHSPDRTGQRARYSSDSIDSVSSANSMEERKERTKIPFLRASTSRYEVLHPAREGSVQEECAKGSSLRPNSNFRPIRPMPSNSFQLLQDKYLKARDGSRIRSFAIGSDTSFGTPPSSNGVSYMQVKAEDGRIKAGSSKGSSLPPTNSLAADFHPNESQYLPFYIISSPENIPNASQLKNQGIKKPRGLVIDKPSGRSSAGTPVLAQPFVNSTYSKPRKNVRNIYSSVNASLSNKLNYGSGYESDLSEDDHLNQARKAGTSSSSLLRNMDKYPPEMVSKTVGHRPHTLKILPITSTIGKTNNCPPSSSDLSQRQNTPQPESLSLKQQQLAEKEEQLRLVEEAVKQQEEEAQVKIWQALEEQEAALKEKEESLKYREMIAQKKYKEATRLLEQSRKLVDYKRTKDNNQPVHGTNSLQGSASANVSSNETGSIQYDPTIDINRNNTNSLTSLTQSKVTSYTSDLPSGNNHSRYLDKKTQPTQALKMSGRRPRKKVFGLDLGEVKPIIEPTKVIRTYSRKSFKRQCIQTQVQMPRADSYSQAKNVSCVAETDCIDVPIAAKSLKEQVLVNESGTITITQLPKFDQPIRPCSALPHLHSLCSKRKPDKIDSVEFSTLKKCPSRIETDSSPYSSSSDMSVAFTEKVEKLTNSTNKPLRAQTSDVNRNRFRKASEDNLPLTSPPSAIVDRNLDSKNLKLENFYDGREPNREIFEKSFDPNHVKGRLSMVTLEGTSFPSTSDSPDIPCHVEFQKGHDGSVLVYDGVQCSSNSPKRTMGSDYHRSPGVIYASQANEPSIYKTGVPIINNEGYNAQVSPLHPQMSVYKNQFSKQVGEVQIHDTEELNAIPPHIVNLIEIDNRRNIGNNNYVLTKSIAPLHQMELPSDTLNKSSLHEGGLFRYNVRGPESRDDERQHMNYDLKAGKIHKTEQIVNISPNSGDYMSPTTVSINSANTTEETSINTLKDGASTETDQAYHTVLSRYEEQNNCRESKPVLIDSLGSLEKNMQHSYDSNNVAKPTTMQQFPVTNDPETSHNFYAKDIINKDLCEKVDNKENILYSKSSKGTNVDASSTPCPTGSQNFFLNQVSDTEELTPATNDNTIVTGSEIIQLVPNSKFSFQNIVPGKNINQASFVFPPDRNSSLNIKNENLGASVQLISSTSSIHYNQRLQYIFNPDQPIYYTPVNTNTSSQSLVHEIPSDVQEDITPPCILPLNISTPLKYNSSVVQKVDLDDYLDEDAVDDSLPDNEQQEGFPDATKSFDEIPVEEESNISSQITHYLETQGDLLNEKGIGFNKSLSLEMSSLQDETNSLTETNNFPTKSNEQDLSSSQIIDLEEDETDSAAQLDSAVCDENEDISENELNDESFLNSSVSDSNLESTGGNPVPKERDSSVKVTSRGGRILRLKEWWPDVVPDSGQKSSKGAEEAPAAACPPDTPAIEEATPVASTPQKRRGRPRIKSDEWAESNRSEPKPRSEKCFWERTSVPSTYELGDPLPCGKCGTISNTIKAFKFHAFKIHNGLVRMKGESQEFNNSSIYKILNMVMSKQKRVKCEICNREYKSVLGFKNHFLVCGKVYDDVHVNCTICFKDVLKTMMGRHIYYHNNMAKKALQAKELSKNDTSNPSAEAATNQKASDRRTTRRAAKSCHDQMKLLYSSIDCENEDSNDKDFQDENMKHFYAVDEINSSLDASEIEKFNESIRDCEESHCINNGCDLSFKTLEDLQFHLKTCLHSGRYFKCKLCDGTVKEFDINSHIENSHGDYLSEEGSEEDSIDNEMFSLESDLCHDKYRRSQSHHSSNKLFVPAKKMTENFRKDNYSNDSSLFPELRCLWSDWQEINCCEEIKSYMPKAKSSPLFNFQEKTGKKLDEWNKMDSLTGQVLGSGEILFAGAPIRSATWCPIPESDTPVSQYIALAGFSDPDKLCPINETDQGKGLIQIWNCGDLSQAKTPLLHLSIAHEFGEVWSMAWCPSGIYEETDNEAVEISSLKRLGLLSVAFSDGSIRIYLIPHPRPLGSEAKVFKKVPDICLHPYNYEAMKLQCLKVTWCPSKGHSLIAGSFTNGMVCIWDLTSVSPILRVRDANGTTLMYPINSIPAHNGVCSAVSFSPKTNGQHIVTGGNDRTIKFWDLSQPEHPLTLIRKGIVTDSVWLPHWAGAFISFDDVFSLGKTSTTFRENGFYGNNYRAVMATNATVWNIAGSDWLNAVVQVDESGEVIVSSQHKLSCESANEKHMSKKRYPIFSVRLQNLSDKKVLSLRELYRPKANISLQDSAIQKETLRPDLEKVDISPRKFVEHPLTYSSAAQMYGIRIYDEQYKVFRKLDDKAIRSKQFSELMEPGPLTIYPLMGASSVAWNNNLGSHTWIFVGLNSGLGRVIKLSFLDND